MDVSGRWTAVQGNNTTVVFDVRQSGSDIQVTGTVGGTEGRGGGFVEANVMYFQVDWPGSPNGEYIGQVSADGSTFGVTQDLGSDNSAAAAGWRVIDRRFTPSPHPGSQMQVAGSWEFDQGNALLYMDIQQNGALIQGSARRARFGGPRTNASGFVTPRIFWWIVPWSPSSVGHYVGTINGRLRGTTADELNHSSARKWTGVRI
jgi:hypothetical protein